MATDAERTLNDLIARVGRVRRWLLAISALRSAALGLAFVSLYVGVYALLDHQIRFGRFGRVAAFVLFAALLAGGLCYVLRVLRREMTYANAANYIESRRSFDQQLVAAVEYYEGRSNYPYSDALARQLVQQVHRAAEGYRFDATVARWQGYLLAGFVLLCLVVAGLFVRQNVLFVSAYLARLFQPFSQVQPVSATALDSTSGDVVTSPDSPVTLTAAVRGRLPESAVLVVTRREPNDANESAPSAIERTEARVVRDDRGNATLTATKSFDKLGQYEYHFETPDANSTAHTIRVCEPPAIKSITAQITPPAKDGVPPVPPYEQQVTGHTLEVLPGSRVELKMQATRPLREASVTPAQGPPSTQQANGADSFNYGLTADKSTSLKLDVVSTDGLGSSEPRELQIALKSDERPQFRLVCPEGDYLATDVASVPITFEVTDDFGLASARLYCELPGQGPTVLESAAPQGAGQISLTHTLELEQYDLHVGDSILFYATATDIDTGQRTSDANAASEMYFIEIRPYQQYWHPQAGKPSSQPGVIPEDLITLLEYTRALLKKTWTLARAPQTAAEDRPRFEALGSDVQYCSRLLTKARDDPDAGFSDNDKAVLNQILGSYKQAGAHLDRRDANAALPPEENAYRTLRKFIDELHLKWSPPETGVSAPQQTPERVKLQEQPPAAQADKERLESRLKEMQKKIDSLTRQQQSLKSDLTKALQQERKASPGTSQTAGQSSSSGGSEGQSAAGQSQEQQDSQQQASQSTSQSGTRNPPAQGAAQRLDAEQSSATPSGTSGQSTQSGQEQGSSGAGQAGEQGNTAQPGNSAGQGEQQGNTAQPGSSAGQGEQQGNTTQPGSSAGQGGQPGSSQGRGGSAPTNGGEPTGSEESSSGSPGAEGRSMPGSGGRTRQSSADLDARLRMLQARQQALREQVTQLESELGRISAPEDSDNGGAPSQAQENLRKAIEAMKQFEAKLADGRYGSPTASESAEMAAPADAAARRLADAGQAIQRRLSGDDQQAQARKAQELADQLARDAEAYDESLSEAERKQMLDRLEAAKKLLESMAGPQWGTIGRGGTPGAGHVYTNDSHTSPAEAARMLAREFWSVTVEARQRQSRLLEDEPSNVEFFEAENEFFENAAQFGRQSSDK
jgi:hypothetical protein